MKQLLVSAFTVSAFTMLVCVSPAFADGNSGPYVGAGVGQFQIFILKTSMMSATPSIQSPTPTTTPGKHSLVGGSFRIWLSKVRISILVIPATSFRQRAPAGNTKCTWMDSRFPVIGTLPLGPIELFAKAGYYYNVDLRANVSSRFGWQRHSGSDGARSASPETSASSL